MRTERWITLVFLSTVCLLGCPARPAMAHGNDGTGSFTYDNSTFEVATQLDSPTDQGFYTTQSVQLKSHVVNHRCDIVGSAGRQYTIDYEMRLKHNLSSVASVVVQSQQITLPPNGVWIEYASLIQDVGPTSGYNSAHATAQLAHPSSSNSTSAQHLHEFYAP